MGLLLFKKPYRMEIQSTAEIRIHKFILSYGVETLISWLDHFDTIITSKDYPLYRNLEREACRSCDITLADMHSLSTTPCTNAKKIISFIAIHQLRLKVPSVAKLLNLSDRTVNYYIKDATDWIDQPKSNKMFMEAYNRVIENFKIK
jgi:hypothetical protein